DPRRRTRPLRRRHRALDPPAALRPRRSHRDVKLPRGLTGDELAHALRRLGYEVTRQSGSHLRLTTQKHGEHHVTIPRHDPLHVGTLSAILAEIAKHHELSRESLLQLLF